jgi:putative transcriptional regulator
MAKRTNLGLEIEAGLKEVLAHRRGKTSLRGRVVEAMPAERVKAIVRKVAKNPKDFERRFGVPARTIEGWEQNKKIDIAGRVLLTVIEKNPDAVEKAIAAP